MLELSECLSPEDLDLLEESFPSGLAARIVMAMVREKQFERLDLKIRNNSRVQVPVRLQKNPGDMREERIVDSPLARILLEAAECVADGDKI